ncbi:HNH endonuclease [Rothia terrae]|uniref:HNH endonuclease n=1 Tax=Rothia terrae TaxID=396015 RepID=UPI0038191999
MGDGQTSRLYRKHRIQFKAQCAASNAPCWLCNQPIDYSIPWKDPLSGGINDDAFELDHLYPRSTHPELAEDPGNYRPSHRSCNRKRSNKMPTGSLGNLTRQWIK